MAPTLDKTEIIYNDRILLFFSEAMDASTAYRTISYHADHGLGNPVKCVLQENDSAVMLFFDKAFAEGLSYTLSISGISDKHGNELDSATVSFVFTKAALANRMDVIFTEILADPSPAVALPAEEFVEIFNRSENEVDLGGWKVQDENSVMVLDHLSLLPGEYLILSKSAESFNTYGKAVGSPDFPSLTNSGDMLVLHDAYGTTIDSIFFNDSWYRDKEKKNGGWSLEIIDTENLCSGTDNWIASEDPSGGTPGRQNSVFANKPDLTGPSLIAVIPVSTNEVRLTFNERLEESLPANTSFTVDPFIAVDEVHFQDASLTDIIVTLAADLRPDERYTITADAIRDCAGNVVRTDAKDPAIWIARHS